jgi:A/G-specific adenine glycosylase
LKLKGVGPYTAAAIASFAFKEKKAVVDGNVYRVLSRVFGIDEPINKSNGQKLFQELADSLIDPEDPDLFNQAIMEFGATECTPKKPNCTSCIFNDRCLALATNKIDDLPVKLSKVKVSKRYLHYLMLLDQNRNTRFVKRPNHGIWAGLYEFPLIESDTSGELTVNEIESFLGQSAKVTLISKNPIVHKLSHRHLEVSVYRVEVENLKQPVVSMDEIDQYPTSTLMERLLQQFKI